MKNKENKNKNKTKQKHKNKNSTSLWITVILSLIAFVLFGISYYYKSATFLSILIIIFCILGILASIWLLASTICNMLKTLINEYKAKNNLFFGALSIFLVSALIAIFIESFGNTLDKGNYEVYHSLAGAFLSAVPAWFGLMGVYYTATIQGKRRSEDFIISNTPYPLIEFSAKKDLKNGKKKTATMKVSNLADNILISISIGGKGLEYKSVTKNTFREFENLEFSSFENNQETLFVFKDANGRRYTTKLRIYDALNEQPLEEYIIIENEKPILDEKEVSAEDSKFSAT